MSIDIDELVRILPQLIRENDTVKGAILTALSGIMATREDINDLKVEIDQRFDKVDQRFDKVDQRFDKVDQRLSEIAIGADVSFERFCKEFIQSFAANEGKSVPFIEIERHFNDPDQIVNPGNSDVEVDLFCPNPPIIGDVTYKVKDLSKLDIFIRKVEFIEREVFQEPASRFFFALEISRDVYPEFQAMASANKINVITK